MALPQLQPGLEMPETGPLVDRFGRVHTYLRVSVTDRCNFRCSYCMPAEGLDWMPNRNLLTFEEITRLVRVLARCGIEKIRLTGGEPTVRRDIQDLVAMLGRVEGIRDLSMTTNAHLFGQRAHTLARAGLKRVNISLDTLDPEQFRRITRGGDLRRVLAGIEAARSAGLTPIRINAVILAGENDDQLEAMAEYFAPHAEDTDVRFIEYMPFGADARRKHLPAMEMRRRLEARHGLEAVEVKLGGGPAAYWRLADSGLRVGFISPMTEHFCQACNRLRLTADGHLRTCLSREPYASLRDVMRAGVDDAELEQAVRQRLWRKVAGHEAHLGTANFEGVMTRVGG